MAHYAWSKFHLNVDEYGKPGATIAPGETVTAKKLEVSEGDFEELIAVGAVRPQKYPPVEHPDQSPSEFYRGLAGKAAQGQLGSDEISILQDYLVAGANEATDTPAIAEPEGVEPGSK